MGEMEHITGAWSMIQEENSLRRSNVVRPYPDAVPWSRDGNVNIKAKG